MLKIKFKFLAGVLCLSAAILSSQPTYADVSLLAEPYLGYGFLGSAKEKVQTDGVSFKGVGFGGRVGGKFGSSFFLAADASYFPSLPMDENKGTLSLLDGTLKSFKVGLTPGVELNEIGLRFWTGLYYDTLSGDYIISTSNKAQTTYHGMSYKVGAGYKVLPYLSVNAEFILSSYVGASIGSGRSSASVYELKDDYKLTGKILFLSVSAPLSLFDEKSSAK